MKIICEIGSNWKTFDDCFKSIKKAKDCGADAVKFQLFTKEELYGDKSILQEWITPFLNSAWIHKLYEECKNQQIEFMCTGFSQDGYSFINDYVNTHKIASAEITDTNILKKVNSFKKPVYLSTGGADIHNEIKHALLLLKDCPVTIMFCVSDYPAKIIDFRILKEMKSFFGDGYSYGYSDHSIDVLNIPIKAKEMGCTVIEKHVNFFGYKDTNDAGHSLNEVEFKMMCSNLKDKRPTIAEVAYYTNQDMVSMHKRRFVATKPILKGSKFIIDQNVSILRPKQKHILPILTFRPWDINNQIATQDKQVGDVITYNDVILI